MNNLTTCLPISKDTNWDNGNNFVLRASPICRTISPRLGAGNSDQIFQASSEAFMQDS